MFIENAGEETVVVCPANILVNKMWNGQIQMFGNYTSLGSFHLLFEGEGILVQKFKELYCYMHPKIFNWESRKTNLDFKAKLYSFALNLFSLIFNKEICYPLYCSRDQMTITINQAKQYMERSNTNIKKSFGSKIVKDQLQNIEDKVKGLGMGLFKFFSEVFLKEESCKYTSWVGILHLFQPDYFKEYEAQTQKGTFRAIKIIYDS